MTGGAVTRAVAAHMGRMSAELSLPVDFILRSVDADDRLFYTCKVVRRLFSDGNFGSCGGMRYVFTGRIFEELRWDAACDALVDWMRAAGFSTSLLSRRLLDFDYRREWEAACDANVLSPRMDLMCFSNCVVDFSNMMRYGHSKDFACLKDYGFAFDMKAKCPAWLAFLGIDARDCDKRGGGVLADVEDAQTLQEFMGAMLVDRWRERFDHFMVLHGCGYGGVHVLSNVLYGIFGHGEVRTGVSLRALSKAADRAGLTRGARVLYCSGCDGKDFADKGLLRELSSCDGLAVAGGVERPPLLLCESALPMTANSFKDARGVVDVPTLRSALMVRVSKECSDACFDPSLTGRLLDEREGIFAWMVRGLVRLRRNLMKVTVSSSARVADVRRMMKGDVTRGAGVASGSVVEYLVMKGARPSPASVDDEPVRAPVDALYMNYVDFCDANRCKAVDPSWFLKSVKRTGFSVVEGASAFDRWVELYFSDGGKRRDALTGVPDIEAEIMAAHGG